MQKQYNSPDWGLMEFTNSSEIITDNGYRIALDTWNPRSRKLLVSVKLIADPFGATTDAILSFHDDGSMTYELNGTLRRCERAARRAGRRG